MVAYDENSLKALGSKYGNNYQVTLNQRHLSTKFKEYIETWFWTYVYMGKACQHFLEDCHIFSDVLAQI